MDKKIQMIKLGIAELQRMQTHYKERVFIDVSDQQLNQNTADHFEILVDD